MPSYQFFKLLKCIMTTIIHPLFKITKIANYMHAFEHFFKILFLHCNNSIYFDNRVEKKKPNIIEALQRHTLIILGHCIYMSKLSYLK